MPNNEPSQEKSTVTEQTILRLNGLGPADVDEELLELIHDHCEGLDSISIETVGEYPTGYSCNRGS
ncbi:hypothetical protein A4G99_05150 [Haladaptatus sp. R4]|uniref:hypothetical protein n=1 Tax=Haladaptatus sp. R4 TaxID=1679489 RepID=UPI0007B4952D|nr:hypothetical protein [Haladaptatus sp. R4]KZN25810.1 hypothetical protein A4G99_05150 [Haladaptatus sp. R4]